MKKKVAVGVDIGGTSVKLGLVDENGKVLARESFITKRYPGRKRQLAALVERISGLRSWAGKKGYALLGVGVGAPGPVDVERGFVYFFPNIPGWKNTPLKLLLEKRLGLGVTVDNDANAMAFGEYRFGAGRGARNMIALTLGTGIGGGLVMDGKLFHGPKFSAVEVGHIVIDPAGVRCGCGNRGCVETFVGSGYIFRKIRRTPQQAGLAARKGDRRALKMWKEAGEGLGTMLAGLVNVLNPERIVLGGGIAQNGKLLFEPVRKTIQKKAFSIAARSVRVVPAKLGVDAGLIGAAALIFGSE